MEVTLSKEKQTQAKISKNKQMQKFISKCEKVENCRGKYHEK